MALLDIAGVSVRFGNVPALRGVSLSVDAGEAVAVLGANGAGKTTLLRAIMGRVPVESGTLTLDGEAIGGMRTSGLVDRGLSLCPEGRQLFPAMSVEDNLLLGANRAVIRVARARLATIYDRFPWLRERRGVLAGAFSGGEQQIVAIGRALMAAPRLLLLDEPSSGLSPVAIGRVRELLGQVRETGTAILLVEQNVQLAAAMTGRGYVLNRGAIAASGDTAALVESEALADAYLGGAA